MTADELKAIIRTVPDFPRPGIQFRDITTLIAHGPGFAATLRLLAEQAGPTDLIAGIEARGFIFGGALAQMLGCGFVPLRKPGKLPVPAIGVDYALEYGVDRLELDPGAIGPGQRVLLVDDLIATGGTALAAARLLRQAGAFVEQALFVIDLPELGGADRLRSEAIGVEALMNFSGH
jgi:adenine phosphoribosyltransferase